MKEDFENSQLRASTEDKNELTGDDFNSCPEAVYDSLPHNEVSCLRNLTPKLEVRICIEEQQ